MALALLLVLAKALVNANDDVVVVVVVVSAATVFFLAFSGSNLTCIAFAFARAARTMMWQPLQRAI